MINSTEFSHRKNADESEIRFRTTVHHSPIIIWTTDADGYCTYVNQKWLTYTGQTMKQGVGVGWLEAVHPGDVSELEAALREALKTHSVFRTEYQLRSKDGLYRWMIDSAAPRFDEAGDFVGYAGWVVERDDKKRAGEAPKASEKRLTNLLLQSPLAVAILEGEDMVITLANDAIKKIWGKGSAVEGKSLFVVLPELTSQGVPDLLRSVYETEVPYLSGESPVRFAHNGRLEDAYFNVVYQPFREADNRISGVTCIAIEVTTQASVNKATEERERRLQATNQAVLYRKALLEAQNEAIPDGILIVDAKGKMLSFNQKFVHVWGIPQAIIDEKNDTAALEYAMTQLEDPQAFIERVDYLYAHPNEVSREEVLFKNGKILERYGNGVIGDDGTYYGWAWYFRDITEQKRAESALQQSESRYRELVALLEQKVAERTGELATLNARLVKSNRDLEQFAYVSSHDLQEPLRKIQTFTDLVHNKLADDPEVGGYVRKISESARRMSQLIRDVLNYSRITNANEQFVATDLNTVLANVRTDFDLLVAQKGAVIQHSDLPTVSGIPLQLNQLFANLIGNSLKFVTQTPVITITSARVTDAGRQGLTGLNPDDDYVRISFQDNGIGFAPEFSDRIFTMFQRLHPKTTFAGTGIGLALCKKIVENHNGLIVATGQPGQGARFDVYLPVADPFQRSSVCIEAAPV